MDTWSFLSRCFLAGAAGAWAASFLIHLYFAVRHPEALKDGQYVMVFLFTVPVGWLLGSIIGTELAYLTLPPPHPAVWKTAVLIIAGVLGSPLVAIRGLSLIWLTIILPVELLTRRFR